MSTSVIEETIRQWQVEPKKAIMKPTVKGRSDDMVIIRGTNIFPGQIESVLMKNQDVGSNWRMLLTTENDVDMLNIEVESKNQLSQIDSMALERKLREDIKGIILFTVKITIIPPNTIQDSGLKAKRVIDEGLLREEVDKQVKDIQSAYQLYEKSKTDEVKLNYSLEHKLSSCRQAVSINFMISTLHKEILTNHPRYQEH